MSGKVRIPWVGLAVFMLGALLTGVLFLGTLANERAATQLDFKQAAAIRVKALANEIRDTVELLELTSHHLELLKGGDLAGFQHYIAPMLDQHPYLQAIGFNPLVTAGQRAEFERQASRFYPGFAIADSLRPGEFKRAGERERYFPFLYAEPLAENRKAIGFDVAIEASQDSQRPRLKAMTLALEKGIIVATSPVPLVLRKSSGKTGVVIFSPLYKGGKHLVESCFGFATLVIRVGDMVSWSQRTVAREGWKEVAIVLEDVTDATPLPLYGTSPAVLPAVHYTERIDIPGGRRWRVVALPVADGFSLAPGLGARTLLWAGLVLSLLAASLLQVQAGKADEIRRLVQARTAELATANQQLTGEVALRQASEDRLRQISALQQSVLANAGYAIIATDNEGIIRVFNPAAERMLGYRAGEVIGKMRPTVFHHKDHIPDPDGNYFRAGVEPLDQISPGTPFDVEMNYWSRDGKAVPIILSRVMMLDDQGQRVGYLGIAYDISSRKVAEERIARLTHYDTLTNLPNRVQLRKELRRAIMVARRSGLKFGVMSVDLDRFKNINDSLGHHVGDTLVQQVADRLLACVREGDVLARMGGDEFIILLPGLGRPEDVADVADRVLTVCSQPIEIDKHQLTVTLSIGIVMYPGDGGDGDSLIQNADTAMYSAKEQGRNCYRFFTRTMNEAVSKRLAMESQIRQALRDERFLLHYQPQFDARSGRLIGAEALIRMRAGDGALVPPGSFIPVAEDSGLILPIGEWVLAQAVARNRAWLQSGLPAVPIAVNVSARQFEQADFLDRLQDMQSRIGLAPEWIEIELTESTLMQSADQGQALLNTLKASGFRIAIDDFGTGFSSLAYLRHLPLDRLKIDKSFVDDISEDGEGGAIVQSIIELAHQLSLEVIAEGVETESQAQWLRQWGCDAFQGYLFGRPQPAGDFTALLRP